MKANDLSASIDPVVSLPTYAVAPVCFIDVPVLKRSFDIVHTVTLKLQGVKGLYNILLMSTNSSL